ncbi:MAG: helix-turn-helix transcriptional regulator [Candidatus Thorarchaeota archaeon]|nr:helix-turn-helix transcriptional regulator [Candidatus Thorarchaeota archaeon]
MKPIKALFNQLGRSWTVSIMLQLGEEKELRYHEIREHVNASEEGNISDATLSKRLSDLTKLGLIKRKVITETPPQVTYSLTAAGEDTYNHIQTMTVWAQEMCHSGDSLDLSSSRNHKSEEVSC